MVEMRLPLAAVHALEARGLEGRFIRELNDLFDEAVADFRRTVLDMVAGNDGLKLTERQRGVVQIEGTRRMRQLEKRLAGVGAALVTTAAAQSRAAKDYATKTALDVTVATLGVAASGAGPAMPGTTAVAIVGLIRSAARLGEEIASLVLTLEEQQDILREEIETRRKSHEKGARGAKELGKETVNALIGAEIMLTHKSCTKHHETCIGTLNVLAHRVGKQQRKVVKAIADLSCMEGELDAMAADRSRFRRSALRLRIKALQSSLDGLLGRATRTVDRVARAEKEAPKLARALAGFGENSDRVQDLGKAIGLIVNLGFSAGSVGDSIGQSVQALNIAANTLSLANDVESELIGLLE